MAMIEVSFLHALCGNYVARHKYFFHEIILLSFANYKKVILGQKIVIKTNVLKINHLDLTTNE